MIKIDLRNTNCKHFKPAWPPRPHLGHVHEATANQGDGLVLQCPSQAVQLTSAHGVPGSIPDKMT